jgi:predicted Zn finger-like uncharacterized protein
MDVRCDRCQTEYELDDASVTADGATVQCTTCGHTFVVTRPAPFAAGGTPAPMPAVGSQPSASWMLTTEEGKTHRFRDSTTLQKWIVERRVTRGDRVCPPGSTWRRLGEIDELRPFFEVVDQADRAAAATRVRPTRPETPRGTRPPSSPYVSPDPDDDDVLTTGGSGRSRFSSGPAIVDDDDLAAAGLGGARRGRALVILVVVALAGAAGYLGFKRGPGSPTRPAAPPLAAAPPEVTPLPPPSVPTAPPVAAAPPAPPVAAPGPAAAPARAPAPAAPVASANAVPAARTAPAHAASAPAGGDSGHPHSYERLVAEADRAIENGQTLKAQKLYDEALHLQSNGVAAMTGSAYVLLDRHKPLAAIDTFKRALGISPGYAPALFGLGEAYRLEGQPTQAIGAYKRYLDSSPSGADAPAARRQLRDLESQAAPRAASEPPTAP